MSVANPTFTSNTIDRPQVMGIINATPDSFYDGGQAHMDLVNQIDEFNQLGVNYIDIGAESSRPGAAPVSAAEEIDRLAPFLGYMKEHTNAVLSVDTYKPETAAFALANGANIINDISGGESPELLALVAKHNAGIILMHKQGTPKTMQDNPTYDDAVADVKAYLKRQVLAAKSAGIANIIVDPGIGFGKTLKHNLLLLKHIDSFLDLNCPILIGTSNKSFIGQLTGAELHERIPGSLASVLATYQKGAHIFRVHNVKETLQALKVFEALV